MFLMCLIPISICFGIFEWEWIGHTNIKDQKICYRREVIDKIKTQLEKHQVEIAFKKYLDSQMCALLWMY